jgi:LacI family transcriptional regulator
MHARPRIRDIAKLADVSIATVSLVLNNKPGVGKETRERVLELAHELQYEKREGTQQNDRTGTTAGTIRFLKISRHGHTVNRDHTVFISDYIDGITSGARTQNYKIEVSTFDGTPVDQIVESLNDSSDLSGAVVLGTELSRDDINAFQGNRLPVVFLDTFIDFLPFDFVDMNNQDSVYRAIEHFVLNGHQTVGMVRSTVDTRNFQLRHSGFLETMSALGLPIHHEYVYDCDSTFDGAYRDMRAALASGASLPPALFCTNDIIAFGVLKAIREAGYQVPEDVSVIGFDDLPTSALLDPPLTSVRVSKWEIGNAAVNRLIHRIDNPDAPVVKIVIGGTLMERASVRNVLSE